MTEPFWRSPLKLALSLSLAVNVFALAALGVIASMGGGGGGGAETRETPLGVATLDGQSAPTARQGATGAISSDARAPTSGAPRVDGGARDPQERRSSGGARPDFLARVIAQASPELQAAAEAARARHAEAYQASWESQRAAWADARAAMVATPFDLSTFEAAQEAALAAMVRRRRIATEVISDMVASLTPERRQELKAAIEAYIAQRQARRGGASREGAAEAGETGGAGGSTRP